MRNIDRSLLRCFDALVTERSVSRAAERLGMSQPAMSNALARLRDLIGDPLLVRARGAMAPTERALELLEPARAALAQLDRLFLGSAPFDPASSRLRFTLTAPEYVESTLLPPLLERLQREAPRVELEVRSVNPERALEWLEHGELDFRLGWVREPSPQLHSRLLFRDRFVCLARRNHPRVRGTLSLEDYLRLPHIEARTSARSGFWRALDEATAALRARPRVAYIVQDFVVAPRVVARTDLIATVPERFALGAPERRDLQFLKPPLKLPPITICAYWHERTHHAFSHRWFRTLLAEVAACL